jgi:phage shock protein PspC (stress-responsive transcriptional regulator)
MTDETRNDTDPARGTDAEEATSQADAPRGDEPGGSEAEAQTGAGASAPDPQTAGASAEQAQEAPAAATAQFAPQVPAAPLHHRLMRRPEGKMVAGVCTGLGAYTGTDPVLWRIGFVVLTLAGGSGILAYIVAWLVMPEARRGEPMPYPRARDSQQVGQWVAIAAVALGAFLIFRGLFNFNSGWFWGLLLIGVGVAVWGRDLAGARPPNPPTYTPPPEPRDTTTGSPMWSAAQTTRPQDPPATPRGSGGTPPDPLAARPGGSPPSGTVPPTAPVAPRPLPPQPPRPPREPSILGRVVVGIAALAIGGALLLDNVNVLNATPKGVLAVLLAIVGIGLLVGTWWGRARWLIIPGFVLAFMLAMTTLVPFNTRGGFGDLVWHPRSLETLKARYEHSAGQAVLDLTDIDFTDEARSVDVRLGFGELLVIVPRNVDVEVDAHVQGGETNLFGEGSDGWDVDKHVTNDGRKGDGPLKLDAWVTFGELTVRRGLDAENFDSDNRSFNFNFGRMDRRNGNDVRVVGTTRGG